MTPRTTMKATALFAATAALLLVACGPSEAELKAAQDQAIADSLAREASAPHAYSVDVATSNIRWQGNMTGLKSYSHFGTLTLNSGEFTVQGGQVVAGTFEANMKSINPQDSGYSATSPREGLVGHLSTADFFAVDSFPTATLRITGGSGNTATAELTLRGKTNTENITDIVVTETNGTVKATGKLAFDRQKYGVAWTAAKDMMLADNIELTVELNGTAVAK